MPVLRRILRCVLLLTATLITALRADDATDRARETAEDTAQIKRIWTALIAYQKKHGKLPDQLSDIVPEFLPNPKDLLSPRAIDTNPNGHEKHPTSYRYEWGPRPLQGATVTETRTWQLQEFGPIVPLVRCFHENGVLNISHGGDIYESYSSWENSETVLKLIAERGLGPGVTGGKSVELTTIDPAGTPVTGVTVTVKNRRIMRAILPTRTLTTGDDGRVRIPFGPTLAMSGILTFEKPGYFAFPELSPQEGFPTTLRASLYPARPISGIVTDPDGKPLPNTTVFFVRAKEKPLAQGEWFFFLRGEVQGLDIIGKAETDPNGKWKIDTFPDYPALAVKCIASHRTHAVKTLPLDRLAMERDGYFTGDAKLVLAAPFLVRGKVTLPDGAPAAGASVSWFSTLEPAATTVDQPAIEAKTNASGEFELRLRLPGASKVAVVPKSGAAPLLQDAVASPGTPPLVFQLEKGRVLKGKAINLQNRPVPGVQIYFTGWEDIRTLPTNPLIAITDAQGNWQWPNAPAGAVAGTAILPSGNLTEWSADAVTIQVPPADEL